MVSSQTVTREQPESEARPGSPAPTASQVARFLEETSLVAVLDHSGRAGNSFFLTVFDQHPQVLCCPLVHYLYSYILTELGDAREYDTSRVRWFVQERSYHRLVFQDVSQESGALIHKIGGDPAAAVDREHLRRTFDDLLGDRQTISRRELVLLPYLAYAVALGRRPEDVRYVMVSDAVSLREESVCSAFSGRVVEAMVADFSQARLISLVRDPRATFASPRHQFVNSLGNMYGIKLGNALRRMAQLLRRDLDPDSCCVYLYWLMYISQASRTVYRKKRSHAEQFLTVRNEDLNTRFVETLDGICDWLGVETLDCWSDEGYEPTMLGQPWAGMGAYNSRYQPNVHGPLRNDPDEVSRKVTGPNEYVTRRWRTRLNAREIELIERLFREEIVDLGYEILHDDPSRSDLRCFLRTALLPFEGELPSLRWLRAGLGLGLREFADRCFYAAVLPPYYVASRLILMDLMLRKRFFAGVEPWVHS